MSFPRYSAYKDSGVEWLGEVPEHWSVAKTVRFFKIAMGQTILKEDLVDDGRWPVFSATDGDHYFGRVNDPQVRLGVGDIVIPARGNSIGAVKIVKEPSTTTQTTIYCKNLSQGRLKPEYVFHFLRGCRTNLFYFTQTAIPQITVDEVGSNPILIPPLPEQARIAAFLDRETAKIDALVAEQQRLIDLLKEKRQAVISYAVTKGLNPAAPMKPSGIEWLGDVPAHWNVGKCGFYLTILSGFAFPSAGFTEDESATKLLRGINVGVSRLKWEETVYWDRTSEDGLDIYDMRAGDVVIGMDRPLIGEGIRVSKVKDSDLPCLLLQRVASLKVGKQLHSDYLLALISSEMFIAHFLPDTTGVSVPHISPEQIRSFIIPVPPMREQELISAFINDETAKFDTFTAEAQRAIDLLQERRTALISAAVTGQIDVRHLAEAGAA